MQLMQRIRGYKNQIFGDGNDIATGFNDVSQIKENFLTGQIIHII